MCLFRIVFVVMHSFFVASLLVLAGFKLRQTGGFRSASLQMLVGSTEGAIQYQSRCFWYHCGCHSASVQVQFGVIEGSVRHQFRCCLVSLRMQFGMGLLMKQYFWYCQWLMTCQQWFCLGLYWSYLNYYQSCYYYRCSIFDFLELKVIIQLLFQPRFVI